MVFWVGSVLYRSRTRYHNDRLGCRRLSVDDLSVDDIYVGHRYYLDDIYSYIDDISVDNLSVNGQSLRRVKRLQLTVGASTIAAVTLPKNICLRCGIQCGFLVPKA